MLVGTPPHIILHYDDVTYRSKLSVAFHKTIALKIRYHTHTHTLFTHYNKINFTVIDCDKGEK